MPATSRAVAIRQPDEAGAGARRHYYPAVRGGPSLSFVLILATALLIPAFFVGFLLSLI